MEGGCEEEGEEIKQHTSKCPVHLPYNILYRRKCCTVLTTRVPKE